MDAQLLVNPAANPAYLLEHKTTLLSGGLAKYYLTRVKLKTFTFSSRSQSLSIHNAVLGSIYRRLLFTIIKNKDFLGSLEKNPFRFRHYDLIYFSLYVYGKQNRSGGLNLDMCHEKTSFMAYRSRTMTGRYFFSSFIPRKQTWRYDVSYFSST
jgi:hypothetical protein